MLSLGRIALAVVVLASIGCEARADRVYDDTTLTLHAYQTPRPGEILLTWTGGPSGFRRWEYSMSEYRLGPQDWTDDVWLAVPEGAGRGLRLAGLESDKRYRFKIRERGDERDPAEINPRAVTRGFPAKVRDDGTLIYWDVPLEPGARFRFETEGMAVTAPPEGEFVVWPLSPCFPSVTLIVTLPAGDDEVRAMADLLIVPRDGLRIVPREGAVVEPSGPAHELPYGGPTARESAEQAATPELRAAYRLLVQAIESMFGDYPRIASEQLEWAIADAC